MGVVAVKLLPHSQQAAERFEATKSNKRRYL